MFSENDGSFTYPDSNNGENGKRQTQCRKLGKVSMTKETNTHYRYICNMTRAWKNEVGFKFGGLLIDTLVYDFSKNMRATRSAILMIIYRYLRTYLPI